MHSEATPIASAPKVRATPREPQLRRLRASEVSQAILSEYRRACGQSSPLILRISSSRSGSRVESVLWDRPSLIIGRSQECDLRLPHAEVARQHALLQVVDGQVYCTDLGSGSGTHWAGGNSRHQGALAFNEPVSIGPYQLRVEPAPQLREFGDTATETEPRSGIPDGLFLDFQEGGNTPRRWPAIRPVTVIGSGDSAKITLVHPSVSKSHCAIIRTKEALWVVDLLSEEGTLVNGDLVSIARLQSGDQLQIGPFSVTAHYGSPLADEFVEGDPSPAGVPTLADNSSQLAQLQEQTLSAANQSADNGKGLSEQFVLDVINQLGVMQQQALQHAQQTMAQALQAVTSSYQQRIATLEQQYEALSEQLNHGTGGGSGPPSGPALPHYEQGFGSLVPLPPGMVEPEFENLPEPDQGSYECDDPEVKEQWVREKMKLVEAELDKTRKGWGKRLIDLMGY